MMGYYMNEIKPKHNELRRALGIKTIEVRHESFTHLVPVIVTVNGKQMKATEVAFYKALGLCL